MNRTALRGPPPLPLTRERGCACPRLAADPTVCRASQVELRCGLAPKLLSALRRGDCGHSLLLQSPLACSATELGGEEEARAAAISYQDYRMCL